ncbi:HxlR family transcriptional regulator [Saccharopolyspora erythraea NRRL 2338]|uniref:Helix-turn-helix domain-containing protein n=1 Tax=Saccharopolyspora erythraea TaxID=1836 RepID=A0ABP3MGH1_SACER|nr:helix-turn-helix domain-containing protein [Saccharopolyspora erythraea]PFG96723.1 HxlR family transcriptional regulator [Saccharopolyspora erythraea NRRL 2338]QRK86976.1 helix-turn-helix transcriptional regulator [Saccharopolyspora erythraea]
MDVSLAAGSAWTDPACPVARTVDLIGDRWSLLIIRDAMDGATAFTEFHQRLGIARNILTDRLRKLVEHGILDKSAAADGRRHTYRLTEAGHDLFTAVVALRQWGERHAFAPDEPHSVLVDDRGRRLPELHALGHDGAPLSAEASHVRKTA